MLFEVSNPDNEQEPYLQSAIARAIKLFSCSSLTPSSIFSNVAAGFLGKIQASHNRAIDTAVTKKLRHKSLS